MTTEKYDVQAEGWSDAAYADSVRYLAHRAELVVSLGPVLSQGDTVLDLACGDAGLAGPLLDHGLRYAGVDLSPAMVGAARRRFGDRIDVVEADLNVYEPPAPVACTTCFRAVYYARDRMAFFRQVASFTEKKLVFDLNPRQFAVDGVVTQLEAAGLGDVTLHPFFSSQRVGLPRPVATGLEALERTGLLARALLRLRFTYLLSAAPR
jgi:SAM-dependent methyltransferase